MWARESTIGLFTDILFSHKIVERASEINTAQRDFARANAAGWGWAVVALTLALLY